MHQDETPCIIKQEHTEAEYINILSNFYETYSTNSSSGFQQVVILEKGEYLIQKYFKEH